MQLEKKEQIINAANKYLQTSNIGLEQAGKTFGVSREAVRKYLKQLEEEKKEKLIKPRNRKFTKCTEEDFLLAVELYKKGLSVKKASAKFPGVSHDGLRQYLVDKKLIRNSWAGIKDRLKIKEKKVDERYNFRSSNFAGTGLKRGDFDIFGLVPETGEK